MKQLDRLQTGFGKAQNAAEDFADATKDIGKQASAAGRGAEKGSIGLGKFASSLVRIAKYRVLRTVIKEIGASFREGLENVRDYSSGLEGEGHRIAAAFDNMSTKSLTMRNQLGSAFAELLTTLMPIIEKIVAVLTRAANAISQFFAALGGNAKYYKAVDATEQVAKNLGSGAKQAKEIRNQLMGFDVINRLDAPQEPSGGGGGGAVDAAQNMFEYTEIADGMKKIAQTIQQNLPLIEAAAGGSLLAIGALLTFSGANIPLGLGLMAVGAYMLGKAAKENWNSVSPKVQQAVTTVAFLVGSALLAVGAILAFSGVNIPLGIGLMAAGAASLATSGVAWGKLPADLAAQVSTIAFIVSAAFLVLGFVFLLTGNIPLGIGLMTASGALAGMALHFGDSAFLNKIKEIWGKITDWFNTHVKKYFTMEYWRDQFQSVFSDPLGWLSEKLGGIVDFLDRIFAPHVASIQANIDMGVYDFRQNPYMGFASGGFPEDGFFYANHNELVGQFSNGQTAVANNAEIIAGIERGVYNAMSAVMANQNNDNRDVRVYLDGRQISNAVTRNQRNADRAMGAVYG